MSLRPTPVPPVPPETARVAEQALRRRRGHPYLKLREALGPLFTDALFAPLFPPCGQSATAPWRLALVLILQFAEGLSDRQAAEAVCSRLDWKYLLSLELTDPGFDYSVLSEFRDRLVAGGAELLLFETLLTRLQAAGLVKARGKQRTDATHVLAAARLLNRLELVGETMRCALDALAVAGPEWLQPQVSATWVERYGRRFTDWRLPTGAKARDALIQQVGADGQTLLVALAAADAPVGLRQRPAVAVLQQVWEQQYVREGEQLRLRRPEELAPAAQLIASPHDPEARCGKKRETVWVGYKAQFTESCEAGQPRLITDVQTLPAPTPDQEGLPPTQAALAERGLLPATQLVDAGYTEGAALRHSQEQYQIDLLGPVAGDTSWQAQAGKGFAASDFAVDWEAQTVTCPGGKQSLRWREREADDRPVIKVYFPVGECRACPHRADCTRSTTTGRSLTLPAQEIQAAVAGARARQQSPAFAAAYAARAGVEGTHAQALRRCGLRQCRYVGQAKTHLQHVLTATAINFMRTAYWLMNQPIEQTRQSRFVRELAAPT
jgi:transposase